MLKGRKGLNKKNTSEMKAVSPHKLLTLPTLLTLLTLAILIALLLVTVYTCKIVVVRS